MDQREEIKQKIDIVSLISERVALKKTGANFKGLCPFHSEKTPSFIVSPERQIFHCFGCGEGGDIFTFLMKSENIEFVEALRTLAERAGVKLEYDRRSPTFDLKEQVYQVNHLASEFYQYVLLSMEVGERARKYLEERQISKDSIERFGIGYAPKSWDVVQSFFAKRKFDTPLLEKAGLVVSRDHGGYYDRFRGRLMFTLRDHRGNVVGFAGRVMDKDVKEAKYVNTPETVAYHKSDILYGLDITKDAIKKAGQVIVVEGEIDLISSYQAGVTNVVAIKGSALTAGHTSLIKRFTNKLALALDADIAGDAAARRGIEIADQEGFDITVVRVKDGKDPDECVKAGVELWKQSVTEAIPLYDFFIESAVSRYNRTTAEGKRKIGNEVLPLFARISNDIVQQHYLSKLADTLGVSVDSVTAALRKFHMTRSSAERSINEQPFVVEVKKAREDVLERYLLSLLLHLERNDDDILASISHDIFADPILRETFKQLIAYYKKRKTFDIQRFVKFIPNELVSIVDQLFLYDTGKLTDDREKLVREVRSVLSYLNQLQLRHVLFELSIRIKEAEAAGDADELQKLMIRYKTALGKLKKGE